ncbi:MAG: cytochrome c3 family protein, partial [Thermodesulfobacteriota bacterium]
PAPPAELANPVINMEEKAYAKHTKSIVVFSHQKHVSDYGATCGDCHHDAQGKPLANLKPGDKVEPCIACHTKPGEMPKEEKKALQGLSPEEKAKKEFAYQADAVHENCRSCHKTWNQEHGKSAKDGAPTSCNQCHAK